MVDFLEEIRKNNTVIGNPKMTNGSRIVVEGSGNVLLFGKDSVLEGSHIHLTGDNALVYVTTKQHVRADITVGGGATLHIGNGSYYYPSPQMRINVDQDAILWLGNDILSSVFVELDTDGAGKQLVVGDHVWFCHGASIKGNSNIASNTIVASKAALADCHTDSFTCWGGENRELLRDVIFSKISLRKSNRLALLNRDKLSEAEAYSVFALGDNEYASLVQELSAIEDPQKRVAAIKLMKKQNKYTHVKLEERVSRRNEALVRFENARKGRRNNAIIGTYQDDGGNSRVKFDGSGNTLIVEDGVTLSEATIHFYGDNGLVYLSSSSLPYRCAIVVSADSCCYIGHDNAFSAKGPRVRIAAAEGVAVVIGDKNSFGNRVWVRTSDQHAIYTKSTLRRINPPEGVVIGNGATLGADAVLQKGAVVEDGEEIDQESMVLRKKEATDNQLVNLMKELSQPPFIMKKRLSVLRRFVAKRDS